MSYEDYVHHIKSKYELAVAIAIIKTKPNNITTETHINNLKQKILGTTIEDLESVCSNDFLLDNDFDENETHDNLPTSDQTYCSDNVYNELVKSNNHNGNVITKGLLNITNNVMIIDNNECQGAVYTENMTQKQLGDHKNNDNTKNTVINDSISKDITIINHHIDDCDKNDETDSQKLNDDYLNNILKELNDLDSTRDNITQTTFCESTRNFSLSQDNYFVNKQYTSKNVKNINLFDSQETVLCSLPNSFTHYSQSQTQNIVIADKFIHKHNNITSDNNNDNEQINFTLSKNNEEFIHKHNNNTTSDNDNEINVTLSKNNEEFISNDRTDSLFSTDEQITHNEFVNGYNEKFIDNFEDYLTDSQKEVVPFKVIDEMNKIKTVLYRKDAKRAKDGYSSDSGYKSDAQIKVNALQSNKCLNQGGHCLFSYIISCTLLSNTEDITNEVSQVLGDLIDSLHDEELYPEFLEELLNYIESTIKHIYEDNEIDNVLLNKDEQTQRILLLNSSPHIQKYTIDRLLNTIIDLHEKLKIDNTDTKNIIQIENSCYIFHLLELLIQKYMRKRNLFSQNSSQSDDEKSLKRSSLTEIWRKKWIPNYKEIVKSDVTERVCIETKCSEVLNKIIVECMDGYSLLSYSALKCFNLLQP